MNRRPNTHDDPLVTAYLTDLDRALASADPLDRADTLQGVREHIDTAVAEGRPVTRVIADLGPVERTAAAAGTLPPPSRGTASVAAQWRWTPFLLAGALAAWPFVLVLPWVTALLALVVLGVATHRLWGHGRQDRPFNAAAVIATLGFVAGAFLLIMFESPASQEPSGPEPAPVQTTGTPVD